jgi:hypothetical protein
MLKILATTIKQQLNNISLTTTAAVLNSKRTAVNLNNNSSALKRKVKIEKDKTNTFH